ncbi:MAG: lipocalin family protein [Thermoflexibacteraceae bacterium]
MKTSKLIKTGLLLTLLATVTMRCSCDDPKPASTSTQKLSAKIWRVQAARKNNTALTSAEFAQANLGDLRLKFNTATSGNTYNFTRGAATISPSRRTAQSGAWTADANLTTITLDSGAEERRLTITKLTDNAFTMDFQLVDSEDKTKPTISFDLVPAQ